MIDKQSLPNDQNVKWQSVADKKRGSYGNGEENALRGDATRRIRTLVAQTKFIGTGGAKINLDGTYEVVADAGSELLTDTLKGMLQKTFEEDEELNKILDQIKAARARKAEHTATGLKKNDVAASAPKDPNVDTFTPSTQNSTPSKWREQELLTNALIDKIYSSQHPTALPNPTPDAVQTMEDWVLNGGEYPDGMVGLNMGPIDPNTGTSVNITFGYPDGRSS